MSTFCLWLISSVKESLIKSEFVAQMGVTAGAPLAIIHSLQLDSLRPSQLTSVGYNEF